MTASDPAVAGPRRAWAGPFKGLRAVLGRWAALAQADTARRSAAGLPEPLRRDIGLEGIDVLDL